MIRTTVMTILLTIIFFLVELICLRCIWNDLMIPIFKMPELTNWQFIEFIIFVRVLIDGIFKVKEKTNDKQEEE